MTHEDQQAFPRSEARKTVLAVAVVRRRDEAVLGSSLRREDALQRDAEIEGQEGLLVLVRLAAAVGGDASRREGRVGTAGAVHVDPERLGRRTARARRLTQYLAV